MRWQDLRQLGALAWPILIGQLAVIANGVIDTAMTARFSAVDLAALALGSAIYISVFVGASGVLQALSPIIAQQYGAGDFPAIGHEVKQGIWLALLLTVLGAVVLVFPQPFLDIAEVSPELTDKATLYLRILALALPATLGFKIYAAINTALAKPKTLMTIQLAALLLKIPLNALFIFGAFGIPAFGGPGCAIATTVLAWLEAMAAWMLLRHAPFYRPFKIFASGVISPTWKAQRALLALGLPMGLSYLIEVTAFTFMALFIARLGHIAVAGHQVAASLGAVLYMLPLSIAIATSTLVAQAIGAKELTTAERIGNHGMALAAFLSFGVGMLVWLAREQIARAYSPDVNVLAVAVPLLVYIGFYQIFDALQVCAAFILRAYRIAFVPTLIYGLALWGIGLGGGYALAFNTPGYIPPMFQGAAGFWMGNSASLVILAAGLIWYLRHVQLQMRLTGFASMPHA